MEELKVRALFNFNDLEKNVFRKKDDIFYCSEKRYNHLKEHNAVELVEEEKPKNDEVLEENGFFENVDAGQEKIKDTEPVKKPKKKKKNE